jgi:hypothetical protein
MICWRWRAGATRTRRAFLALPVVLAQANGDNGAFYRAVARHLLPLPRKQNIKARHILRISLALGEKTAAACLVRRACGAA